MNKMLLAAGVVAGLAQGVCAAGTWIRYETTVATLPDQENALQDCEVDSKGTLWYVVGKTGLFSQKPDNAAYKSYTLPINMLGERMGLYMNTKKDSLWIGGRNGIVYAGKDGVFSAKPTIPLIYNNRYSIDNDKYFDMTHVTDFNLDSNGRFIASTDSLAWWLNGNKWDSIGELTNYPGYTKRLITSPDLAGFGFGLGASTVDRNGVIWFDSDELGGGTRIKKDYSFMPLANPYLPLNGIISAPDGNLYVAPGNNTILRYNLPNYTVDTIDLTGGTESRTIYWSSGVWQDENGWTWVGQTHGSIKLVKNDKVAYKWETNGESANFVHFKRAPSGDFWACTGQYLYRYSESYSIPSEATGKVRSNASLDQAVINITTQPNRINFLNSGVEQQVRILDLNGRTAWSGQVSTSKQIALTPGLWLVESRAANSAPTIQKVLVP